jgi:hypothetical protein
VNVDAAGVIRRDGVVLPEVVSEPRSAVAGNDQFAGAFVIDSEFFLSVTVEDVFDAVDSLQDFGDVRNVFRTLNVNVGHLVIRYSERSRGTEVECFPAADFHPRVDETVFAQNAINVDWSVDVGDGVF